MDLNLYAGVGTIFRKKYEQSQSGTFLCQITVKVDLYRKGFNGRPDYTEKLWCELTEWSNNTGGFDRAAWWNETFHEGQAVSITGNPEPRVFIKANGEAGMTFTLRNGQIGKIPEAREMIGAGVNGTTTAGTDDQPF